MQRAGGGVQFLGAKPRWSCEPEDAAIAAESSGSTAGAIGDMRIAARSVGDVAAAGRRTVRRRNTGGRLRHGRTTATTSANGVACVHRRREARGIILPKS